MPQKFLSVRQADYERCKTDKASPPWFKVHNALLGDQAFMRLTTGQRFLYLMLLKLAVEHDNKVYNDRTWIGQRAYMNCTEIDLTPLYRSGLLETSNVRRVLLDKRREEKIREDKSTDEETPSAPPPKVIPLRGTVYTEYFVFNERATELAKSYGLNPFQQQAAFKDYHVAKGSVFKDWQAAFRTWLRNSVKFQQKGVR
jgi:hypothetical protein